MQRGFLVASGAQGKKAPSERVRCVRAELEEAEHELRRRRQERLRLLGAVSVSKSAQLLGVGDDDSVEAAASASSGKDDLTAPLPLFSEDVTEALVSYRDPPAAARRVAEAASLVLKAPVLVELGETPLPTDMPWVNVQALLRKLWKTQGSTEELVAALRQEPLGTRLRRHVHSRLLGGETPVLREEIQALGQRCVEAFDFVMGLLARAEDDSGVGGASLAGINGHNSSEEIGDVVREKAIEAVTQQEKDVARLRRKLKEVEQSEVAAERFALKNTPASSSSATAIDAEPSGHVEEHDEVAKDAVALLREKAEALTLEKPEVACCRQLEFKLNDAAITPLHEAILLALIGVMMEPHSGSLRRLSIVGFAEIREEPEVARQRANVVQEWLLEHDVPPALLDDIKVVADAPRGSRRVELHVLGEEGGLASMRQKAEELMQRVLPTAAVAPAAAAEAVAAAAAAAATTAAAGALDSITGGEAPRDAVADIRALGPSLASLEELDDRGLRVIFDLNGVPPEDIAVDVGSHTVRLASATMAWMEVQAQLPFAASPSDDARAARFSKRNGTLIVSLRAA